MTRPSRISRLPYLSRIILAFFDARLYRTVAEEQPGGVGIRYLVRLAAVVTLIVIGGWWWSIHPVSSAKLTSVIIQTILPKKELSVTEHVDYWSRLLQQMPQLSLQQGRLHSDQTEVALIKDPYDDRLLAVIDPGQTLEALQQQYSQPSLALFGKETFIFPSMSEDYPLLAYPMFSWDQDVFNRLFALLSQLPVLTVKEGKLQSDITGDMLALPAGDALVTIAPQMEKAQFDQVHTAVILGMYHLLWQVDDQNQIILAYDDMDQWDIEQMTQFIEPVVETLKRYFFRIILVLVMPLIFVTSLLILLGLSMICGLFVHALAARVGVSQLEYNDAVRLSGLALTPVVLCHALLPPLLASQTLLYGLMLLGYVGFGLKSIKEKPSKRKN